MSRSADDYGLVLNVVILVIAVGVVAFIGFSVFSTSSEVTEDDFETAPVSEERALLEENSCGWVTNLLSDDRCGDLANDEIEAVTEVLDSTGWAIELHGTDDSFVESNADFDLASDPEWTVCSWGQVDAASSGETMTLVNADGQVLIQYNGSEGNWSAWYFNESSRNSWTVETAAPDQPGNLSNVCVRHNETHLAIAHNGTVDAATETTGTNVVEPDDATNWHGLVEETRVVDDALSASQLSSVHSDPVGPLADANRTARLMYDEGSGSSTYVFFADTTASLSNASWVQSGHDGAEMTEGTDYSADLVDGRVRALTGGEIEGAPVAWVSYDYWPGLAGERRAWQRSVGQLFGIIVVALLSALLAVLIILLRSTNGGRD